MSYWNKAIVLAEIPDIVDDPGAGTVYVGFVAPGTTATSEARFKIKKVVTSGNITTTTWADGNTKYDNIWDNRAALTYSFLK